MKKLIIIMIAVLVPSFVMAQQKESNEINRILDKYEQKKSVESVLVSPSLLDMGKSNGVNEKTKELMSKITQLRILSVNTSAMENGRKVSEMLREDLSGVLSTDRYSRILRVQEKDELLEMYKSVEANGVLIFISSEIDELSVISIFGKIDGSVLNAAISGEIKVK